MDTFQAIAMRRSAAIIILAMVVSSCAAFVDGLQQTAQVRVQQFLADQFGRRLKNGIDSVIGQLAMKGGYLDDPLVRILLPPPLGLAIGIVRGLQENPQALLLETLINQAAENTIPVAGPILKNIVMNMETPSLESLLDAGNTAATDYLKEKGGAVVREALVPAITEELHLNGAIELYGKLLEARQKADQITATAADVHQKIETAQQQAAALQTVTQEQLGRYVAEQALSGLFKKVADVELSIRETGDENNLIDLFGN
jgi:hypothetical protein